AAYWCEGIRNMGEHIKQITLLRINDLLHLGHLLFTKSLFGQPLQKLSTRLRDTPQRAQFILVLKEFRQLSKEDFEKLLRRHWGTVWMPKRSCNHMLDRAFFAVGEFNFYLLLLITNTYDLSADFAGLFHTCTRALSTSRARSRWFHFAHARTRSALRTHLFLNRLAIPFRIVE